ncbi:MAG: Crp/Fnr family transcriptional regulator [Tuberibacillus sp.]
MDIIDDKEKLKFYLNQYELNTIFNEQTHTDLNLYYFDQGKMICSQGEPCTTMYILVEGKIKIYTTSPDDKTLILSFKTPLEVIGDIEYVQNLDTINTVEAVSPVYMIGISHQALNKWGHNYSPFLRFLLDIVTQKFYINTHSFSFNLMYPVEVRLASYLLSITMDDNHEVIRGHLRTSELKDIANLLGTSYRHLNRVIQRFCENGWIERSDGVIRIFDRKGLSAISGGNIYE